MKKERKRCPMQYRGCGYIHPITGADGKPYEIHNVMIAHIDSECPYEEGSCIDHCSSLIDRKRPCMKVYYGRLYRGE